MAKSESCRIKIKGMYCVRCEQRIARALKKAGAFDINVSYRRAEAVFGYDENKVSYAKIIRAIEAEGYGVRAGKKDVLKAVSMLLAVFAIYFALQYSGVLNKFAPSQTARDGMGYGMLFLIGILTSVHCIAMCGGINLSQSVNGGKKTAYPTFLYNFGRILSYRFTGLVLGALGSFAGGAAVSVPPPVQGAIKILIGIVLFVMGLKMLGIFPLLQKFSLPLPKPVLRKIGTFAAKVKTPFAVGLLNGFMPCGPLQAMQLIAFSSGNILKGGLSMLFFGLGTMPLMLGFGTIVTALGKKFTHALRLSSAVIAAAGLLLITQGAALSGIFPAAAASDVQVTAEAVGSVQTVKSELRPGAYPEITVYRGVPVEWHISADKSSINGCNGTMVCRELDLIHEFHEGDNIVEFLPQTSGDITYTCWMGMIYGTIHVIER